MAASDFAGSPLTVLIVDDEELLVRSCARILEHEGYSVLTAGRGREALEMMRRHRPDIVLTDLMLPDVDGMTLLREAKKLDPAMLVIMITGFATVDSSIEAIKAGAYDYIPKPFTATQLQILIGRAANQVRLARDNERLRGQLMERYSLENVIGVSEAMQKLFALVLKVAPTDASVFISGESGTGKELIARAIHLKSRRAEQPFVAVNCAAFPENLLESELFGHERGAFTGADTLKRGLMEHASGGTFFLDEICEMSLELQAKLLRALQERKVRRVGGDVEIPVDIRVIAATNRDPQEAVEQGILREDLFFRLNVVPVKVPPLRERRDDIPLLAEHFLRRYAQQYERDADTPLRLSADAMRALVAYRWPGNVRQLQNTMERVVSLATPGQEITAADLPEEITGASGPGAPTMVFATDLPFHVAKEEAIEAFERQYLEALLQRHGGNISQAAREAEIDRKTIHRLLKKYSIRARAGLN
ncbi:MAG TPA: sigma-54 dependent transcriptional regulator [Longimicrobiales bacterium]|nr:sigma-54 dependent transcriptional regulator [Longimicrobiales bacterium]